MIAVISVPQQVADRLEPSDDSSGPSLIDYSERRSLPISIPDYQTIEHGGEKFVVITLTFTRQRLYLNAMLWSRGIGSEILVKRVGRFWCMQKFDYQRLTKTPHLIILQCVGQNLMSKRKPFIFLMVSLTTDILFVFFLFQSVQCWACIEQATFFGVLHQFPW